MSPLLTATSLSTAYLYVAQKFLDQFIKDEGYGRAKRFLFPKKKYSNRLTQVIHKTVDEYKKQVDSKFENGKIPFYHTQILFEKLSAHVLLKTNYSSDIISIFDKNQNIQKPSKEELNVFFTLFANNIKNDKELKKLYLEENYQNEIFKISNTLNKIEDKLDPFITNTSEDLTEIKEILKDRNLQEEWEKQINIYESLLEEFKPKTALALVEKLELRLSEKQLDKNVILQAKIEFLKARCFEKTNLQRTNSFQSYIKSYLLNKTNNLYKEKACVSYYITKEYESAKFLSNEILEFEPHNPIANAIKILGNKNTVIEELNKVSDLVKENSEFKRLMYINLREETFFLDLFSILEFENTRNHEKEFSSLTEKNFKLFLIEIDVVINSLLRKLRIEFHETEIENKIQLNKLFSLLQIFNNAIENTEIQSEYLSFKFYFEYFKFIETKKEQHVFNLFSVYEQMDKSERIEFQSLVAANSLQQINKVEDALKVLNEATNIKQNSQNLLSLKLFCYEKIGDIDSFEKTAIEKFELIKSLNEDIIYEILRIIRYLAAQKRLDEIINYIFKIESQSEEDKVILEFISYYTKILSDNFEDFDVNIIEASKKIVLFENNNFKKYIQDAYYITKHYKECLEVLELIPEDQKFELEIYNSILSLNQLKTNNKELLRLLKFWRENFQYNSMFVRVEIEKTAFINDWSECEIICEHALKNEKNEDFIFYFIRALFINNSKEKSVIYLSEIKDFNYQKGNIVLNVIDFLWRFEFFEEGLELCYKWAKEKDFKPARTLFFANFQYKIPQDFFQFYDIVEKGHYVRYSLNNDEEKATQKIDSDDFSTHFLKLKKNDEFKIKRNYSKDVDTCKILAICNKYMALSLEIIEETKNPHTGLGFQKFTINENESLFDIINEIGNPNYNSEEPYEKYYSEEIKFSHLVFSASELNDNFVKTYYKLIFEKSGILKMNPRLFPIFDFKVDYDYILDFTSVLYFFEFSKTNTLQISKKFKITNLINVILKSYKEDILNNYVQNEQYTINSEFYDQLLKWISENCEEVYPTKLLDLLEESKANNINNENKSLLLYLLNQAAMIEEFQNGVLITDDLAFYQVYPLKSFKLMSPEVFILQKILKSEFGQISP